MTSLCTEAQIIANALARIAEAIEKHAAAVQTLAEHQAQKPDERITDKVVHPFPSISEH